MTVYVQCVIGLYGNARLVLWMTLTASEAIIQGDRDAQERASHNKNRSDRDKGGCKWCVLGDRPAKWEGGEPI